MPLIPHQEMPPFVASTVDGRRLSYHDDVWQRQDLVLVTLDAGDLTGPAYADALLAAPDLRRGDARLVITTDPLAAVPPATVVVADQWGEVYWVRTAATAADLPPASEVADWLQHVQHQCPECQGEAR